MSGALGKNRAFHYQSSVIIIKTVHWEVMKQVVMVGLRKFECPESSNEDSENHY